MASLPFLLLGVVSSDAYALSIPFECLSMDRRSPVCQVGEEQLSVELLDAGGGQVAFELSNLGPESVVYTRVLFEGAVLASIAEIVEDPPDVDFAVAPPKTLPAGKTIDPSFSGDLEVQALHPMPDHGVGAGESLRLLIDLAPGVDFADVAAAIASGELRIGLKTNAGGGESLVNVAVPEAGTVLLLASGLAGLALRRRPG